MTHPINSANYPAQGIGNRQNIDETEVRDRADAKPSPGTGSATDRALDLDGFFGFHPALAPLVPLWKEGTLAAVHAVGSPDPTRSHFDAQDYMESGTPGRKSTDDGWMNRHLKARPDPAATALRAVSLTPTLPRALQGTAAAVAMTDVRSTTVYPTLRAWSAWDSSIHSAGMPKAGSSVCCPSSFSSTSPGSIASVRPRAPGRHCHDPDAGPGTGSAWLRPLPYGLHRRAVGPRTSPPAH